MRCRDVANLSTAYVDGELADRRASALRGHLRVCEHCRAMIQDEAALRDAADELGAVDPPAELWTQVQRGLAEAEIADSRRSRLWLWGPRLRAAALPTAVAMAAAAALLLWMRRDERAADHAPTPSQIADRGPAPRAAPVASFLENLSDEIEQTDREYRVTIKELSELATAERPTWSADSAARFDAAVARFRTDARSQLQRLAVAQATPDPRSRDALYSLYQSHIRFLQRATMGDVQ